MIYPLRREIGRLKVQANNLPISNLPNGYVV
jgi:hypothetical protein